MPADNSTDDLPPHDCMQILDVFYFRRPDLKDQPLENAVLELFID